MPTIRYLLEHGAALVLASHLGRPKSGPEPKFSLAPTAKRLQELLPNNQVIMADDCIGPEVEAQKQALKPGEVLVLENVRFYKGEQKGDMDFAAQLASCHRRLRGRRLWHRPPARHERGRRAADHAGRRASRWSPASCWRKRSSSWAAAVENPVRPFVAILGGAKVSDKIDVIQNLLGKVDALLIGGGMANTFLKAQGYEMGDSLVEEASVDAGQESAGRGQRQPGAAGGRGGGRRLRRRRQPARSSARTR